MQEQKQAAKPSASTEARLRAGERRFSKLETSIAGLADEMRAHLHRQDESIAAIRADTKSIIETWNDGQRAMRLLCRLADAWRFLLKQVALPVGLPGAAIYAYFYYQRHHALPGWLVPLIKQFL